MNKTFPTRVRLDLQNREVLIKMFNSVLATSLDLYSQVKQAHWNIKGPQFFARHELFDKLASRLLEKTDAAAERATTMGGYAMGTLRLSAEHSRIPEYDLTVSDGQRHLHTLAERYGVYAGLLRDAVQVAKNQKDPVSEDLFIDMLSSAELDLWFLESHLHV